jgi:hypothetical protein
MLDNSSFEYPRSLPPPWGWRDLFIALVIIALVVR